jgi:hypothetical protein
MRAALIVLFLSAQAAFGQSECSKRGCQTIFGYSGANLAYTCTALSVQPETATVAITAASNAPVVVFTSNGHGFDLNSRPTVTIAGGTGNWAAANGTYQATIIDANTFSVAVNSAAFGAVTGALTFRSRAPRMTQAVWAVNFMQYDAGGNVIGSYWAGGTAAMTNVCAAPTQYQ